MFPTPVKSLARRTVAAGVGAALLATLSACSSDGGDEGAGDSGRLTVAAAFYPLQEAAEAVAGDEGDVVGLTPPGQGPHDLELDPQQVEALGETDVVFYLGKGFQPQVEEAVASIDGRAIDLLDAVELLAVDPQLEGTSGDVDGEVLEGDVDPHVWLDPTRMIAMVESVVDALGEASPDDVATFRANADEYLEGLEGLDGEYEAALAECESRVIVTSHRAFGYLADRYELRQIPIAGISPEAEPDPRTLESIAAEAQAEGVTTIFLEEIAPPQLAETVAREIDAELSLLDPIEGLPEGDDDSDTGYAAIMGENLDRLVEGLRCG